MASVTKLYLPLVRTAPAPKADVFWADRYVLAPGECTQIHWSVTNVIALYLDNEPVVGEGTRQVCPFDTHTYLLRVVSTSGTQDYRITIVVESGSHPSIEFSADANLIRRGECTILRWRVTGARAVYLDQQGVPGESSRMVCPDVVTTYKLRVDFGDEIATRRITITVVPTDTLVMRFWAEQYTLPPDTCTTLHWIVWNVREVYLDDHPVVGMAALEACPSANQFYVLRAVDASGQSIERVITLMVGDPELSASEVIARGIVDDLIHAIDIDPTQAGDQPGYRLVIDGITPLFTGTPDWAQAVVTLGVPQSLIQSGSEGPVDWPIVPGQQVEFRAECDGQWCVLTMESHAYLRLRSE